MLPKVLPGAPAPETHNQEDAPPGKSRALVPGIANSCAAVVDVDDDVPPLERARRRSMMPPVPRT